MKITAGYHISRKETKLVLLTAFQGTSSERLINCFDNGYQKLILENDKDKSVKQLISVLESRAIDWIISFGQKPVIKDKIYIELVGRIGEKIYPSNFDIDRLVCAFKSADIPVRLSDNAGTSFCNHIYAEGLKYLTGSEQEANMVFLHIPFEKNILDFHDYSDRLIQAMDSFATQ